MGTGVAIGYNFAFLGLNAGFSARAGDFVMPIYEYRCSACGHEKDALQKMSDPPLVECPNCGQAALVKLVSAAGFQLKGSGWYATDFKGGSGGKAGTGKPAGSADAGSKPDGSAGSGTVSTPKSDAPAAKPASTGGAGG